MWVTWPVYIAIQFFRICFVILAWIIRIEITIFRFIFSLFASAFMWLYAMSPIGVFVGIISFVFYVFTEVALHFSWISDQFCDKLLHVYALGTDGMFIKLMDKVFNEYLPMGFNSAHGAWIVLVLLLMLPITIAAFVLVILVYPFIHGLIATIIYKIATLFIASHNRTENVEIVDSVPGVDNNES